MKALLTGGLGFIGGVTANRLLGYGHEVVVLDDARESVAESRVPAKIWKMSIDAPEVPGLVKEFSPDVIMHFAANSKVEEGELDPLGYAENNVESFRRFLYGLTGRHRVIFSSSCSVYGNPVRIPMDEDHPKAPVSWYGWTKLFGEMMLDRFSKAFGHSYVSLRYFNVVGSAFGIEDSVKSGRLIPHILKAVKEGRLLVVHGSDYPTKDGTCVRDYVHVLDIADAHIAAAEWLMERGTLRMPINLGTGDGTSVKEVIRAVEKVLGKPLSYETGPARAGDPAKAVASNERAQTYLGWLPKMTLEDAVRDSVKGAGLLL